MLFYVNNYLNRLKTQPLRKDKHCLNCGTEVPERYCTHCGQENAVPHETFSHLFKHFVADIFHYDSQFLITLKSLLFRPGFLSREYMAGRRVRYVNPIKLYVFVSFVFFFGIFALHTGHDENTGHEDTEKSSQVRTDIGGDTVLTAVDAIKQVYETDSSETGRSVKRVTGNMDHFQSVKEYDAAQNALPDSLRDHGTERILARRLIELHQKYGNDAQKAIGEMFKHNIPKLMFVLLPLFALFMKWAYDKKKWLYADHAIFAIHLHSFAFILGLVAYILEVIFHTDIFLTICYWLIFIYLVLALRNNYGQSFWKSLWKSIYLLGMYLLATGIVFLAFLMLIFSIFL